MKHYMRYEQNAKFVDVKTDGVYSNLSALTCKAQYFIIGTSYFRIKMLRIFFRTAYLWLSCNSQNKQQLFPETVLTSWSFKWKRSMLPVE
jgi:hypothetical protein